MAYRTPIRTSRWKAMAAALVFTGILGAGIISGLKVEMVGRAVERLQTFDITPEKPPPPEEPPPKAQPKPREKEAAPAAPKASSIVAPKPEVQLPTQQAIAAATQAGTGASSSAGQGGAGSGTGTGGVGTGAAGGGNTPARLVRNLNRSDYRRLTGGRMASGSAGLAIRVSPSGRIDSCRVEQSSGDSAIDAGLCSLVTSKLRFAPARDAEGRPIPFYTHYRATWRR